MQYVLTENEYKELCARGFENENELKRKLQHVCTFAANTIPIEIQGGWKKAPNWCVLSTKDQFCYCDDCPVKEYCPSDAKRFSK